MFFENSSFSYNGTTPVITLTQGVASGHSNKAKSNNFFESSSMGSQKRSGSRKGSVQGASAQPQTVKLTQTLNNSSASFANSLNNTSQMI